MSRSAVAVVMAGVAGAFCLAVAFGDPASSAAEVVGLAAGAAAVFSAAGLMIAGRLRHRSLAAQLWVAVLTTVLGVMAGVVVAAWQMFLSTGDTRTVAVILMAASGVGAAAALAMAGRLRRAIGAVSALAGSIGGRPVDPATAPAVPTSELGGLARQLHEIAEHLDQATQRERMLESSRRELVAWVSHDLRTPLASLQAAVEALEDGLVSDPETISRYYRTIRGEVERLVGMVDDLFRLSRIHAGLLNLQRQATSLESLVTDAVAVAAPVAAAKRVRLVERVPAGGVTVEVATTDFLRVLRNLLDNALRHTPEGGQVSIDAELDHAEARIAVRDGCGGLRQEEMARVFDVGYRGDVARSPGTGRQAGLGLAIAQGLISAHGGHIDVGNEPGGCRFVVHLPLGAASLAVPG